MQSKSFFDFLTKIILAGLMSFSLVYPMTTTLLFPHSALSILGYIFIALIIYSVMFINRLTTKISAILSLSACGAGILFLAIKQELHHVIDIIVWLVKYISEDTRLIDNYAFILTLCFCTAFSLFVYIFTIKKFNFYITALSGIVMFSSQWMLDFFVDRAYIAFYTFIISILVYYLMHVYNTRAISDSNDLVRPSAFILGIAPLCVLVLLLTNSIPTRSKPIEWKWLDKKINSAFDYFNSDKKTDSTVYDLGYFSLASTGFTNSANKLGGNITPNENKIMEVKTNHKIYLRGNAYNSYTGNSWVETVTSTQNEDTYILTHDENLNVEKSMDIVELIIGTSILCNDYFPSHSPISDNDFLTQMYLFSYEDVISNRDPSSSHLLLSTYPFNRNDILFDIIDVDRVSIKFSDIRANTLFAPLKSENFDYTLDKNLEILRNRDDEFTSKKSLQKNFSYSFDVLCPKLNNKELKKILMKSSKGIFSNKRDKLTDITYQVFYNLYLDDIVKQLNQELSLEIWNSSNEATVKDIIRNSQNKNILGDGLFEYLVSYFSYYQNQINYSSHEENSINNIDFSIYFLKRIGEFREFSTVDSFFILQELCQHSETNYQRCLELPSSVPKRVKDLAVEITKDETNNYDKVKAIEKYLSSNYLYSLSPGDTPPGEDFVDYFLFEQKRGYCVYHASSMVILARSIGIPARYVEGFVLPSKTNDNGVFEVTNRQSHAWVEIYFEGFGWLTFEPTPSYSSSLYDNTRFGPDMSSMYPKPYETGINTDPMNKQDPNMPDYFLSYTEENNTKFHAFLITAAIILTFFFIVLIILLINTLRRKHRLKRILKMPPKEAVIELYQLYIKHLLLQNMPLIKGETPLEYAKRLDSYKYLFPLRFNDIASVFIKARYSKNEVTEQDKKTVYEYHKPINQKTRKSLGRFKYFFMAYIQGRI